MASKKNNDSLLLIGGGVLLWFLFNRSKLSPAVSPVPQQIAPGEQVTAAVEVVPSNTSIVDQLVNLVDTVKDSSLFKAEPEVRSAVDVIQPYVDQVSVTDTIVRNTRPEPSEAPGYTDYLYLYQ